jgi:hypothetical protein
MTKDRTLKMAVDVILDNAIANPTEENLIGSSAGIAFIWARMASIGGASPDYLQDGLVQLLAMLETIRNEDSGIRVTQEDADSMMRKYGGMISDEAITGVFAVIFNLAQVDEVFEPEMVDPTKNGGFSPDFVQEFE